jgi:hypothetical protein
VADGGVAQARSLDGLANTLDISNKSIRVGARVFAILDTSGGVAVEILATDGDTGNKAIQLVTVLVDGLLKSLDLAIEGFVAGRGPETEEKAGLCLNGGRDGGDGVVGCTALLLEKSCKSPPFRQGKTARQTYNHGVKTSTVESTVRAVKALGMLKLLFEVGLLLDSAAGKGSTIVEALESSIGRGQRRG